MIKKIAIIFFDVTLLAWVILKNKEFIQMGLILGILFFIPFLFAWIQAGDERREKWQLFLQKKIMPVLRSVLILIPFALSQFFNIDIAARAVDISERGGGGFDTTLVWFYALFMATISVFYVLGIILSLQNLFTDKNTPAT